VIDSAVGEDRPVPTDPPQATDASAAAPRAEDPAGAVLRSYRRRLRPWRLAYAAGGVLLLAAAFIVVRVAYSAGELSHTTLRPAHGPAPSVAPSTPSGPLRLAWRTGDTAALGIPFDGGTVVTADRHSVRGRDGITGAVRWSYTRTDRTVCAALQAGAATIAVYRLAGNCDELTALDTATGRLNWTRTLDKDGAAFDGPASYVVTPSTVLFVSATALYAIDPSGTTASQGGLDRWTFNHRGCRITSATLGTTGALISQTCAGEDCSGADVKYCGDGPQLLLRDAQAGTNTDSSTNHNNPDQVKWNLKGSRLRAATAGSVLAAFEPGGAALDVLSASNGTRVDRVPLRPGAGGVSAVQPVADADLLWTGGVTYAVGADGRLRWQASTSGLPATSLQGTDTLARSDITAVVDGAVVTLDGSSGRVMRRYPVGVAARRAWPYGSGFLVSGGGTAVYR
jgi:hypothetical protein